MSDLDILKDIPGYKAILKSVLKSQIQLLIEQLADHTGEESIILTASINDGTLSHLGSNTGKGFLEGRDEIKSQFLGFCLKSHHRRKTQEIQNHSRPSMPQHHPSKRSRIRPVPYSMPQTSSPITASMSVNRKGSISDITNLDQSNNIGIKAEENANTDLDNFLNNVSTNVDNDYASNVPASVHLSHTQSSNQNESFGDLSHSSVQSSGDDQNTMVSNVKLEPVSQDDLDIEVTGVELGDNSLSSEAWGQGYGSGGNNEDRQSGDQARYTEVLYRKTDETYYDSQDVDAEDGENLEQEYSTKILNMSTTTPRKRGRPRKSPAVPIGNGAMNDESYSDSFPSLVLNKKRGRPKKELDPLPSGFIRPAGISIGNGYVKCNICGKVLKATSMFTHKQAHLGIKNFRCEFCGKSFTQKGPLITHKRIHTGEKPYTCPTCGKLFAAQSGLYQHSRRCPRGKEAVYFNTTV